MLNPSVSALAAAAAPETVISSKEFRPACTNRLATANIAFCNPEGMPISSTRLEARWCSRSLRGGRLHVAVKTGRDFFELGRSKADVDRLRQKFLGELHWFTGIMDELRLADTLYRKETGV